MNYNFAVLLICLFAFAAEGCTLIVKHYSPNNWYLYIYTTIIRLLVLGLAICTIYCVVE